MDPFTTPDTNIRAEHKGRCPNCESSIHPGDEISNGPDGWQHRNCILWPSSDVPLCPDCYCYHAGECA